MIFDTGSVNTLSSRNLSLCPYKANSSGYFLPWQNLRNVKVTRPPQHSSDSRGSPDQPSLFRDSHSSPRASPAMRRWGGGALVAPVAGEIGGRSPGLRSLVCLLSKERNLSEVPHRGPCPCQSEKQKRKTALARLGWLGDVWAPVLTPTSCVTTGRWLICKMQSTQSKSWYIVSAQ